MLKRLFIITLITLGIIAGPSLAQEMIQIKGSDTLINLVQTLSEEYMDKYPEKAVIAVTGGGSGVGIAALISNTIAVANSSREIKSSEVTAAKENGVVPTEIVLGIDGLSVVVNADIPVNNLTVEQIGAIFRGDISNWNQVGGPNKNISLYGRQPSSGTYVFFQEFVLGNKNYSPKMKQMNGNAQIIEGIKADKSAIGYVGVGYVFDDKGNVMEGLKVLTVSKDKNSEPVTPLIAENVKSGKYPIARPLLQYTNGKPQKHVKDFIAFELSAEGQKIVEDMGFYPVAGKYLDVNKKAGF
ncbi:MAG TPA: phosphate ABC transporter substrate-binding protein [bacterium]|nr:phosphate ABC transporter substrate-binding protein [bacterium]HPN44815.1 phosphate ABC transporter substrate-binding protein [bacterium]